jgi:hypothetical protein
LLKSTVIENINIARKLMSLLKHVGPVKDQMRELKEGAGTPSSTVRAFT